MPKIIGKSLAIRWPGRCRRLLLKTTVLLLGESGTGKSFCACHSQSEQQEGDPFVHQLRRDPEGAWRQSFRHEKGSFTGAEARKIAFELPTRGRFFSTIVDGHGASGEDPEGDPEVRSRLRNQGSGST
jgi:DNA-binding NtrC family response regulator